MLWNVVEFSATRCSICVDSYWMLNIGDLYSTFWLTSDTLAFDKCFESPR